MALIWTLMMTSDLIWIQVTIWASSYRVIRSKTKEVTPVLKPGFWSLYLVSRNSDAGIQVLDSSPRIPPDHDMCSILHDLHYDYYDTKHQWTRIQGLCKLWFWILNFPVFSYPLTHPPPYTYILLRRYTVHVILKPWPCRSSVQRKSMYGVLFQNLHTEETDRFSHEVILKLQSFPSFKSWHQNNFTVLNYSRTMDKW